MALSAERRQKSRRSLPAFTCAGCLCTTVQSICKCDCAIPNCGACTHRPRQARHTREQSGLWQCQTERRAGRWPGAPSGLYPARGQSALSIHKAEHPSAAGPMSALQGLKNTQKMKFGASDWTRHLEGGKCSGRRPDHLPPLMTFVRLRVRRLQPHSPRDCNTDFSCSSASKG